MATASTGGGVGRAFLGGEAIVGLQTQDGRVQLVKRRGMTDQSFCWGNGGSPELFCGVGGWCQGRRRGICKAN